VRDRGPEPGRERSRSRRREREPSALRPLHVVLLIVLVLGLIGFTTRVMAGGGQDDPAAAAATAAETVAAATAQAQGDAGPTATATERDEQAEQAATTTVHVTKKPPPTYANGAKAPANQPGIGADAYAVLDVDTNEIVLAWNDTETRPIASLTKMMTGLLVAEAGDFSHPVVVSEVAAGVEPNKDGLIIGNRYPRGILLYSAMLSSNNDAAAALGEDLGGSYGSYYAMMNRRAKELGLTRTNYASSSGLNDTENWSTARDQAIMLARAMENPTFRKVVGTREYAVRWPDDATRRVYKNHNDMLVTYRGTIGGKTGFTTAAGGCLAVMVERGGRTLVGVVLGTNDIWNDTTRLMDAGFQRTA
jgi:D-alanyl-D-alanine carboxypeptidase